MLEPGKRIRRLPAGGTMGLIGSSPSMKSIATACTATPGKVRAISAALSRRYSPDMSSGTKDDTRPVASRVADLGAGACARLYNAQAAPQRLQHGGCVALQNGRLGAGQVIGGQTRR